MSSAQTTRHARPRGDEYARAQRRGPLFLFVRATTVCVSCATRARSTDGIAVDCCVLKMSYFLCEAK